ncbi:hypothetical protein SAMN05421823_102529 [Catalinimonas alkaloidigena]|uniref:Uncharacterized protein n=1 Tax=Catalinimonas alkaloidigena TaxID=1075417 RepID=A0A1G9B6I1_9BACT|nr:hypothetical protein [Catalinimonas alkaloidigena]SDK35137.1 hypothetical protein SAMN05421823_102529 [Catalinimonas alkaloidigena]
MNIHRKPTDVEQVIAYMQQPATLTLTGKLQEKLERWDCCDNLIRQYGRYSTVVEMLMKKFGCSKATAYRDIQATEQVFGSINRTQKEYWRMILREMMLETRDLAKQNEDLRTMTAAEKNLMQLMQLDQQDPELPDYSELQPADITLGFFPELLKVELPEEKELKRQIAKLKEVKRKTNLNVDQLEEAKIIP